jgi:hypothetical protein
MASPPAFQKLRHSNLATTQIYLGKVSEEEAFKWIDSFHT